MEALAPSNENYDFNAYNAAHQIWDVVAEEFVTEAVADFEKYRIPATKIGDANDAEIEALFVAAAPAGATSYIMRLRGASLADSYIVAGPGETLDIDGHTLEEAMRLLLAVNVGKVTATSTSAIFRAADDSKARVTATVDSIGNRTVVTKDAT